MLLTCWKDVSCFEWTSRHRFSEVRRLQKYFINQSDDSRPSLPIASTKPHRGKPPSLSSYPNSRKGSPWKLAWHNRMVYSCCSLLRFWLSLTSRETQEIDVPGRQVIAHDLSSWPLQWPSSDIAHDLSSSIAHDLSISSVQRITWLRNLWHPNSKIFTAVRFIQKVCIIVTSVWQVKGQRTILQ